MSCNVKQEVVCKDGKEYLHIHGDCEGGTVRVRLRSRTREPVEVECEPAKTSQKERQAAGNSR